MYKPYSLPEKTGFRGRQGIYPGTTVGILEAFRP
jgi:hypothetical protein